MLPVTVLTTILISLVASVSALPGPYTNGERFRAGLTPRKPSRTFNAASRTVGRRQTASNTPSNDLKSVCAAPSTYALSCSSTPSDTCCQTSPGGLLLQTQFWDTGATSTGPIDSWTLHGLWPDNCDGTYQQYCDSSRAIENSGTTIRAILQSYGETALLSYMDTYWKDYQGNDESFWEHEFDKHGTCISSLNPECFASKPAVSAHQDVHAYFKRAVGLFQTLPTYDWLAAAGIVPSFTATYTLAQIKTAIQAGRGNTLDFNVNCAGSTFDEVWYFFSSQGSVIDGNFIPTNRVGDGSTCPATGIKWLPKYQTIPVTPTDTLAIYPQSVSNGVVTTYSHSSYGIISQGSWYMGTAATIAVTTSANAGFVNLALKSSGAPCAILSTGAFSCLAANTASDFTYDTTSGKISYQGSSVFSASKLPPASTRIPIYFGAPTAANPLQIELVLATKS